MSAQFSVYVHWADDGRCLYVGQTARGMSRHSEHQEEKAWFDEVEYTQWVHCPTRLAMDSVETALIHALKPEHNKADGPKWREWAAKAADMNYQFTVEKKELLDVIEGLGGEAAVKDIAASCVKSVSATSHMLGKLEREGRVKRVRHGVYATVGNAIDRDSEDLF